MKRVILPLTMSLTLISSLEAGFMQSAEDFVKGVGKSVSDATKSASNEAGINLSESELQKRANKALENLYKISPKALELSKRAKAILVFPDIIKAGIGIGGMYGEGVLYQDGNVSGYYNIVAGSYGMQFGAQSYAYAMFFMDKKSIDYLLKNNEGWEVGTGPSVVLVDKGLSYNSTNTTMNQSVYLFTFGQKGLMAGTGIQGSKITRINPSK